MGVGDADADADADMGGAPRASAGGWWTRAAGRAVDTVWRWWMVAGSEEDASLVTKGVSEMVGCMMFHFIGSVSPTAAANGLALLVIVYYTARMSGAHLNPAVTLTFMLLGHVNPVEMIVYWAAQVAGCVLGALWVAALVPGAVLRGTGSPGYAGVHGDGCFAPQAGLTDAQVLGWEAMGTFCFLVPIFAVVWYTQTKSGYGNTGPLIVGLSLTATALAVGQWTGAALNPARAMGSVIVLRCAPRAETTVGLYVAGEAVGAALVPLVIIPWYGIAARPWYWPASAAPLLGGGGTAVATPQSTPSPTRDTPLSGAPSVRMAERSHMSALMLEGMLPRSAHSMRFAHPPAHVDTSVTSVPLSALLQGGPQSPRGAAPVREKTYVCANPFARPRLPDPRRRSLSTATTDGDASPPPPSPLPHPRLRPSSDTPVTLTIVEGEEENPGASSRQ